MRNDDGGEDSSINCHGNGVAIVEFGQRFRITISLVLQLI